MADETLDGFKAGDVVNLKSGSDKMTVEVVKTVEGINVADCVWYPVMYGQTRRDTFPLVALVKV